MKPVMRVVLMLLMLFNHSLRVIFFFLCNFLLLVFPRIFILLVFCFHLNLFLFFVKQREVGPKFIEATNAIQLSQIYFSSVRKRKFFF